MKRIRKAIKDHEVAIYQGAIIGLGVSLITAKLLLDLNRSLYGDFYKAADDLGLSEQIILKTIQNVMTS